MNAERLIRIGLRIFMRYGMRYFTKRGKTDPKMQQAAQKMRMGRRIGRF